MSKSSVTSKFGNDARLKYRLPGAGAPMDPVIKQYEALLLEIGQELSREGQGMRQISHEFDAELLQRHNFDWVKSQDIDLDEDRKFFVVRNYFTRMKTDLKPKH